MQTQKTSSIQKLIHTFPWAFYYCLCSLSFFFEVYYEITSTAPFGAMSCPPFICLFLFMFVFFSISVQSPHFIVEQTKQVDNVRLTKLLVTVGTTDIMALCFITYLCITEKYSTLLILVALSTQIIVYTGYIFKALVLYLHRAPIENFTSIASIEVEHEDERLKSAEFQLLYYLCLSIMFALTGLLMFISVFPLNSPFTSMLWKNLYCFITFYCASYTILTACSLDFYLRMNSGNQSFYFAILKMIFKNLGVVVYMAFINLLCVVCKVFFIPFRKTAYIRTVLENMVNRHFSTIAFYDKVGIVPIVIFAAALDKETDQVVDFIRELEVTGDYPYINSFSSICSVNTTKKTSLAIILVVILPLCLILMTTSLFAQEYTRYFKMMLTLLWGSFATSGILYIYSQSMHYAALLTKIQGNIHGNKWIDKHLNSM